jgi:hypothetical protein
MPRYFEALKYVTPSDRQVAAEVYSHLAMCFARKGDPINQQKYAELAKAYE